MSEEPYGPIPTGCFREERPASIEYIGMETLQRIKRDLRKVDPPTDPEEAIYAAIIAIEQLLDLLMAERKPFVMVREPDHT